MVGLTHMGYSPYGDEIDSDVLLAEGVAGIDVIVGGHSHTFLDPAVMVTSDINPEGTLIAQAGRYATESGQGQRRLYRRRDRDARGIPATGRRSAGRRRYGSLSAAVCRMSWTLTPARRSARPPLRSTRLQAYTEETSGANVQADAAVYELTRTASMSIFTCLAP